MSNFTLEIELLSDTTFSSGGSVSGLVDAEVQHDEFGLPTISGRALKGLLVNECAEILYALPPKIKKRWQKAALHLFGERGETEDQPGGIWIGMATLAPDLVATVQADPDRPSPSSVLDSLTAIRTQTAMSEKGAPKDETLRAVRVVIRGVKFYAPLWIAEGANQDDKALLAACVKALRRAGSGRTRGRGKISARINDHPLDPSKFAAISKETDFSDQWFKIFKEALV